MRILRSGQCNNYYDLQNLKNRLDEEKSVKQVSETSVKSEIENSSEGRQQYHASEFLNLDEELLGGKVNDMERAIKEMKKDTVLQQYNFFVSSPDKSLRKQDKNTMPMENFDL